MKNFTATESLVSFEEIAAKSAFEAFDFRLACVRDGDAQRVVAGAATGSLQASSVASKFYQYQQLSIWRGTATQSEVHSFLESLQTGGVLTLPSIGEVIFKGN